MSTTTQGIWGDSLVHCNLFQLSEFFGLFFALQPLTYPCSEASGVFPGLWENSEVSEAKGSLELGLSKWKVELLAALQVGATEVQSMILKVVLF